MNAPMPVASRPDTDGLARQAELAHRQAQGLRALADMIEAHPHLADRLAWGVGSTVGRGGVVEHNGIDLVLSSFVDDPRATMAAWARAARTTGAATTQDASDDYRMLRCDWADGAVRITMSTDPTGDDQLLTRAGITPVLREFPALLPDDGYVTDAGGWEQWAPEHLSTAPTEIVIIAWRPDRWVVSVQSRHGVWTIWPGDSADDLRAALAAALDSRAERGETR